MGDVIERLQQAGKTISLGSLALVMLEREAKHVRQTTEQSLFPVEANDLSALGLLAGKPHMVGPLVNVYNAATAKVLAARGAQCICLPPELPLASIREIIKGAPDVAFEIFTFGRIPLAISARCAHARSKGHIKDNCQFVCAEEPDGLPVKTLDSQSFLALNGVQTLSHTCQALIEDIPELKAAGVARSGFRRRIVTWLLSQRFTTTCCMNVSTRKKALPDCRRFTRPFRFPTAFYMVASVPPGSVDTKLHRLCIADKISLQPTAL